jgi:cyclic pyranopterin phosphate synthase
MPEKGISLLKHEDILSYNEITDFVKVAVVNGFTKVRFTGGEPLVRKGIVTLTAMISDISGISDLSMTTNGTLLEHFADDLSKAGLQRVNISLDTVDPEKYALITRTGKLSDVFKGIKAAKRAHLLPVKVNCVIKESKDEEDARSVARFCEDNDLELRFIKEMDLEKGVFSGVEGGTGGNCAVCNRLRLTPTGKLKPCLFSNIELDIRKMDYDTAIKLAIGMKPEQGIKNIRDKFYNIGG